MLTKRQAFYKLDEMEKNKNFPCTTFAQRNKQRSDIKQAEQDYYLAVEAGEDIRVEMVLNYPDVMQTFFKKFKAAPVDNIGNISFFERKIKQYLQISYIKKTLEED